MSEEILAKAHEVLDNYMAVSYTHLDVYKRQPQERSSNLLQR